MNLSTPGVNEPARRMIGLSRQSENPSFSIAPVSREFEAASPVVSEWAERMTEPSAGDLQIGVAGYRHRVAGESQRVSPNHEQMTSGV